MEHIPSSTHHPTGSGPGSQFIDHQNSLTYSLTASALTVRPSHPPDSTISTFPINPLSSLSAQHFPDPLPSRFLPDKSSELLVSPNGFYLINQSDKEQIKLANISYDKGVHFWEFYCPLSLYGLGFGVARKDENKLPPQLFTFTASTHRSVYMKLDLEEGKLYAWVNKQKEHVFELPAGDAGQAWIPCVSLKGKGNVVIFNPFSTDPFNTVSKYNPFNTNILPTEHTSLPLTAAKQLTTSPHELSLHSISQNQILLHSPSSFKVLTRNPKTIQFNFDYFVPPQNPQSLIELTFSQEQFQQLNQYLRSHKYEELKSQRRVNELFIVEATLKNWFGYLKFLVVSFDLNSAFVRLYEIVLGKLERIRGYVHLLDENLQPLLYSEYNVLTRWRSENEENHFHSPSYQFTIPVSQYTNYFPAITLSEPITTFSTSSHYLILTTATNLFIYNTQVIPILVFQCPLSQLLRLRQSQLSSKSSTLNVSQQQQGCIYQILAKCVSTQQETIQVKKLEVNDKFLKTLVDLFKYPEDVATQALLKTKSESVEEAIGYIELNKSSHESVQRKKSEQIEHEMGDRDKVVSLKIVSNSDLLDSLTPIVFSIQTMNEIRVFALTINNQELQKLFFKEEKGIISFINFEYLKNIKQIKKQDAGVKNILLRPYKENNYFEISHLFKLNIDSTFRDYAVVKQEGKLNLLVQNQNLVDSYEINLTSNSLVKSLESFITMDEKIILSSSAQPNKDIEYTFQFSEDSTRSRSNSQLHQSRFKTQILDSLDPSSSFLPLLVKQGPPGCNMNYPICSILYPSTKFLSNYPFTIILQHLHDKYMKINTIVIERIGRRKGMEIKEGLIWTSNQLNQDSKAPLNERQGYRFKFKFEGEQKKLILKINETEFKKYLFIMPIYDESKTENMPFEIGFVGITGEAAEDSSFITSTNQIIKNKEINKLVTIKSNNKNTELPDEAVFSILNDKQITLRIPHTNNNTEVSILKPWKFISKRQVESVVEVKKEETLSSDQIVQEIISKQNVHNIKLLRDLSSNDLSTIKEQATILKLLDTIIDYPSSADKKSIIYQLTFGPFNNKVKQHLNNLLSAQQRILPIDVVDFILYHKLYSTTIVEPLLNQLLSKIKSLQSQKPAYKELREQGHNHLFLESDYYSDYYYNLVEGSKTVESSKIYKKQPLPINIAIISERFVKTFLIDLKSLVSVNHLLLCFEKSQLKTKMRVRVYDQNKTIIFGNLYQDSTWIQLTKNSHTKEMKELFANPIASGLNSLGINLHNVKTRYLIVQISYTILPIIGEALEITNVPNNEIIPEVYGDVIGEEKENPSISNYLNPNPEFTHQISNININNISEYFRFSASLNSSNYHIYKNSKNIFAERSLEEMRQSYNTRLEFKDYVGSAKLLKELIQKSNGKELGLDYYYTLLIKLLEEKVPVSKETANKIYTKLVLNERGPVRTKSIKYLISDPQFYEKCLSLLSSDTISIFISQKIKQKQIRSYIKNTLTNQSLPSTKSTELLISLLRNNPDVKIQDWLEEIIILSSKTNQHKDCFKMFERSKWIEIESARKYLVRLGKNEANTYAELIKKLNIEDVVRFSVDLIKGGEVKIGIDSLEAIGGELGKLDNEKLVNELLKILISLLSKSLFSETVVDILENLTDTPKFHEYVVVTQSILTLNQHIQLSFERILSKSLLKQPHKTYNLLFDAFTKTHFIPTLISKLYLKLLSSYPSPQEEKPSNCDTTLTNLGNYLIEECNHGGVLGVQCITEKQFEKLIWIEIVIDYLLKQKFVKGTHVKNVDSFSNIALWLLLNGNNEIYEIPHAYRTTSYNIICKLEEKLTKLFEIAQDNKAKIGKKVIEIAKKLNNELKQSHLMLQSTKHSIHSRLTKGAINLLTVLLKNDPNLYAQTIDSQELSQIIAALKQQSDEKNIIVEELLVNNNITNLFVLDKDGDIKTEIKNWAINTSGNSKAPLFTVSNASAEFTIVSPETVNVNRIIIGFLTVDNASKNNVYPESIDCYAGEEKNKLTYLGTMNTIDDQYYVTYNTRVFGLNLDKLKQHQKQGSWIRNIVNRKFKYLKFKINRPALVSLSDLLESGQKSSAHLNYGVSFITMQGLEEPTSNPYFSNLYVKLLSLLSHHEMREALKVFLKKDSFKKRSGELLTVLNKWVKVYEYQKQVLSLLISISEQSQEVGNNILTSLMKESNQNINFSNIISEMISKATTLAPSRVEKFHHYIVDLINSASTYYEIHLPISLYLQSIEVANINMEKHNVPSLTLTIDEKTVQSLLRIYSDFKDSQKHIIIEFLNVLLLLEGRISIEKSTVLKFVEKIWQLKHRSDFYYLIAALVTLNKEVLDWFIKNEYLKVVVAELLEGLDKNIHVTNEIVLLSALSYNSQIKEQINKNTSQITIFKSLSDTKNLPTLLKNVGKQALKYFVEFFKNTCIDSQYESLFAEMLKDILSEFSNKYEIDFVFDFFFPLINSYKSIPLILQPYSRESQLYLYDATKILNKDQIKINSYKEDIEDKFLTKEVKSIINKIGEYWVLSANHTDFPNKAKILYIESENPVKNILVHIEDENNIVVLDGTVHYFKVDETLILNPNIQLKIVKSSTGLLFEHKGFETKPKLEAYKVFNNKNKLIINEVLRNAESSSVLDTKYKAVNSPLQYITKQNLYLIPSEITIQTLTGQISLQGLSVPKQHRSKFSFRPLLSNSSSISSKSLLSELPLSSNTNNVILKLQYDAQELFELTSVLSIVNQSKQVKPIVSTEVGLFRSFQKQGGVSKMIEVLMISISNWKRQAVANRWLQLVQELKSFSSFPTFFSLFMENKNNVQLLFGLLAALPDSEDEKMWQAKEKEIIKFCYETVTKVLNSQISAKSKEAAYNNNIIEVILQRLHFISKEIKRSPVEQQQEENKPDILPQTPQIQRKISQQLQKKPPKKKKGVGYGTDDMSNTKWNKQEQQAAKKQTSEQILTIMKIFILFFESKNWVPPKSIVDTIYASSLLPIIESALRAGSLLEISKTAEIFQEYLKFIRTISTIPSLVPILFDVPTKYVPCQPTSIYNLLKQLEGTNKIFLNVSLNADSESKDTHEIAQRIIQTFNIVNDVAATFNNNKQQQNQRILQLPTLRQKYPLLLQDLRFQYINMKDKNNKFIHHFSSNYSKGASLPATKMIRLAQEIADASTALPNQHTNAIFIRCDKERVDFMQALIMGSNGTPYGHGAYLFDIYFQDTYPETPPKVNLTTTGSGKVRFNPNLYSCGKVCLSLLGTWRGNPSESWDPKVSTLLQVLVSIQSIIMSEDVYFNEPGFEGEQGTVEAEKKNQGYANIVRYCNIKYAMIQNIKNPPKGFQSIIKRHFYLKKDEIMEEVNKWLKYASKREALYTSLVSDHNNNWCKEFKKSTTRYKQMLEEAVAELEKELNKLEPPSIKDMIKQDDQQEVQTKKQEKTAVKQQKIEEIDVSYNEKIEEKELNVDDEKVKDRWSRYIGAMGIDAVSRQSKANILMIGLGQGSLEVIKNLVLSGCKKLSIVDNKQADWVDLSGNFFLSPEDVGKKRLQRCLHKIQELNFYVKVQILDLQQQQILEKLKQYQVVITSQLTEQKQILINTECHKLNIPYISLNIYGAYARLFNDFGESFEVLDKNGEDPIEVIVESITNEENGKITLLQGIKHPYEDGDVITINKVEGMDLKSGTGSINGTTHKIKVINSRSFSIGDTREYTEYIRSGIVKNVKLPVNISFKTFDEVIRTKGENIPIDDNLAYYDFSKISNTALTHHSIRTLSAFIEKNQRLPLPWNYQDSSEFVEMYKTFDEGEFTVDKEKFVRKFSFTASGSFPPLQAFMGGFVAQQVIKAITKKYKPTNPMFYCDFNNVIKDLPEQITAWEQLLTEQEYKPSNTRFEGLRRVVGDELLKQIENCKVFMIGSGAIGCQLLKNYAMIELGTGEGAIHLTDPDHIEVSNLNRQFLFREKHLRKPKSATAAYSVIQMNQRLKGHIHFRLDKVSEATKDIFTDEFFKEMTIITNALDNIQARRYVDQRCLENRRPLLESGTLGPKGHVQVIIPDLTETYGSKEDPAEEGQIPHCTLKMFPQETLHCVEWARDKFGQKFTLKPKALQKIIQSKGDYKPDISEIQSLRESLKMIQKKPDNFADCIHTAINKFYSYYRNDIKQLIYTYPLDFKTKDGQPFWKLPKRPPTPIEKFDPENILHCTFVTSYAVMLAKIYDLVYPQDFRKDAKRFDIGKQAAEFTIEEFVPSDKRAKEISEEVSKEKENQNVKTEEQKQNAPQQKQEEQKQQLDQFQLVAKIQSQIKNKQVSIIPEEFDKDEDQLGHIDLIYSMANLRSINYALEPMDWITTKLKAGKIVPALVTTTTSIAALQTYELIKYLKKLKITEMRNSFLNLAVPIINMSEPGEVEKIKVHEKLTTNIWDVWEVEVEDVTTLRELFDGLEGKYQLKPKDLIVGSMPVYMSALLDLESKKEEKEKLLGTRVKELVKQDNGHIDVTVTFTLMEGGDLVKKLPKIRIVLK